jgi:hypothetical protein
MSWVNLALWRPWFQRIWVMQEAVLAHDLMLQFGAETISWEDFWSAVLKVYNSTKKILDKEYQTIDGRRSVIDILNRRFYQKCCEVQSPCPAASSFGLSRGEARNSCILS